METMHFAHSPNRKYDKFVGTSPSLSRIMGCHRNHTFSQGKNRFIFEDNFVSHIVGPNEQLSTNEKLS